MGESVKIQGIFELRVYKLGVLISHILDENLVVTLGREAMAKLLSGDRTDVITKFQAGTNGTPPALADNAITGPFEKTINTFNYPVPGQVRFEFSVETTEANGMVIEEFGLLFDDGVLFNRKTVSPIVKDNTLRFDCLWTIKF